ncbi:hypothetical protein SG34_011960 [Thalassomonas viridans]|uniref:Uncharacterized protein n=1 Tax=Thalassomonas viridans TaxID=137584 RepID=A0AAF0C9H9_9GAMM|nr:hypothetical protein [Thalassomonas viridans]WDE07527.1 hypothetical protein SG34_011960 [Thalassomonas viridans]
MEFLIHNVIIPMLLIWGALSKLDVSVGKTGAQIIYSAIEKTAVTPERSKINDVVGGCYDACFGSNKDALGFILHIFFITLVCVFTVLSIYTYKHKGLLDQFASVGFLRQFLFQGFLTVYIINFLMYSYYPRLKHKFQGANRKSIIYLLFQVFFLNVGLFVLLTVFTHIVFYVQGWSGHTSAYSIINSVREVLLLAISFKSLSGVYLYSVLVNLFPFFLVIFLRLLVSSEGCSERIIRCLNWLNFKPNPIRAITLLFTAFVGVFCLLLSSTMWTFTTN